MLTANRPELARRAVECFRAQTYDPARRELLIYDTGDSSWFFDNSDVENEAIVPAIGDVGKSIGILRNLANTCTIADRILIHWDDDDWSHPNRIAEQVELLQSSGADVVGYNEMLFWDRRGVGEAWLYTQKRPNYALGTSLCYWRAAWERKPFAHTSYAEDLKFITGLKCVGVSSCLPWPPRMIASIHGGNTSRGYDPKEMARHEEWRRVPERD